MHAPRRPWISCTIGELIEASARRHRALPALRDQRGTVSYGDMIEQAVKLANVLQHNGLSEGDRVAILTEDDALGVIAYVGTWLAGCAAVCVNARQAPEEVAYILEDADVSGLLWSPSLGDLVADQTRLPELKLSLAIDPTAGSNFDRYLASASTQSPTIRVGSEDLALLGYTSGTTGRPKGAMLSHGALMSSARVVSQFLRIPPRGRLVFVGSLSFPASFSAQILTHLYLGGMIHLLGHYDVDKWFSVMRADRSTYTYLPTPLAADFIERVEAEPSLFDHLQFVLHGAAPLLRAQLEAVVAVTQGRFLEVYGMTESSGTVAGTSPWMYSHGCEADDLLSSVGQSMPTGEMWIEREDGTRANVGEVGEIVVSGDTQFDGYWNAPEKTAIALRGGGFHSGDLGSIDAAGFLYVRGRQSELIISGGINVYPAEVERVLLEHPDIALAAVFGLPHPRWGEGVAAAVQLHAGARLDEDEVIDYCRTRMASYKKPTRVFIVDALPMTVSLKVNKPELRLIYGAQ